jgi:hypothetical protein
MTSNNEVLLREMPTVRQSTIVNLQSTIPYGIANRITSFVMLCISA